MSAPESYAGDVRTLAPQRALKMQRDSIPQTKKPGGYFIDIPAGTVYGQLTVIRFVNKAGWLCRCVCGTEIFAGGNKLRRGKIKTCGCKTSIKHSTTTHGMTGTSEYTTWKSMKARCHAPNSLSYKWYGARGIKVCDQWRASFETFLHDMGLKPSSLHSIDRIDNDGDYEPANCRWATNLEQMGNRRPYSEWGSHK